MEVITANAVHVDTVQLSHVCRLADLPLPEMLVQHGFEISLKESDATGSITTARFRPLSKNSHEPRLTVTRTEKGYCGIRTEVSIAKLLDGNGLGIQTDEDINCALDAIEDTIRQRIGI